MPNLTLHITKQKPDMVSDILELPIDLMDNQHIISGINGKNGKMLVGLQNSVKKQHRTETQMMKGAFVKILGVDNSKLRNNEGQRS